MGNSTSKADYLSLLKPVHEAVAVEDVPAVGDSDFISRLDGIQTYHTAPLTLELPACCFLFARVQLLEGFLDTVLERENHRGRNFREVKVQLLLVVVK